MAEEKVVTEVVEEKKPAKKAKTTKKAVKEEKVEKRFANPTFKDFEVILRPVITEKSMTLMQEENKVTLRVKKEANRTEIKLAFERLYQVPVTDVRIVNVNAKSTTRGTRYQGTISGYKKAIVTVAKGEAIDLFKE